MAAAFLVYAVVLSLCFCIKTLVLKLAEDMAKASPSSVGLVASLIIAVSVLTVALAKFSFGISTEEKATSEKSDSGDSPTSPTVEAFKLLGDVLGKLGETFKSLKP